MAPLEHDHAWQRVLHAYHESVVHVPGLTRYGRAGKVIKPLGLKAAAEIAGLSVSDMGNRVNPNMPEHRPTLEGFVRHLLSGMDMASLDEIESAVGRVSIKVPEITDHDDIQSELMNCIKEPGDVGACLKEILAPESPGGRKPTRKQFNRLVREVREVEAAFEMLLAAVDRKVK